jgi:hypothetical protein
MPERRPLPYDWSYLKGLLLDRLPDLLARLNLRCDQSGRPMGDGHLMYPLNPCRSDKRPGSFVIYLDGPARGGFKDYALGDTFKGDVFELIRLVGRLHGKMDAYWWACEYLGLPRGGDGRAPRRLSDAEGEMRRRDAERQAAEQKQIEDDEAKSEALFKLWLGLKPIAGTPAEHYLREVRGIPLDRLKELPQALRWADRVEYVNKTTGEVTEWRHVMVSAMTRGSRCAALHRTYLKPDGSGKRDAGAGPGAGGNAKLMIGPCRGVAIRLSKGPTGLSPGAAEKKIKAAGPGGGARFMGPLAIGEGIETCLTVACARPDYRVWAAGSLSLMGLLDWPACASAIVLLGENDWSPEARRAFERVEAHWRKQAQGRAVVTVHPAEGSDFNDMVRK